MTNVTRDYEVQRDWLRKQLRSLNDVKATHRTRLAVKRLRYRLGPLLAATATTMAVTSVPSTAQVQVNSWALEITFTGRVHTQFSTSSVAGERWSEFEIRRARLTAAAKLSDLVDGRIQPDFGNGKIALQDAFLRLSFSPAIRVSFGQFKRAFDVFELPSSTQILVIERTGEIAGVDACAGAGGLCSWSRLTQELGYSGRDIGVALVGRASERLDYHVTVTNGAGANLADENGAKSYSGRVTLRATSALRLSANVAAHDYINATTASDKYAFAYGGDLEVGTYGDRIHFQAGIAAGQNWENHDATGDPSNLMTAQGIISYRFPLRSTDRFSAIEPLGRISWADPDTDAAGAGGLLMTPGIAFHLTGSNMLVANIDVWSPSSGSAQWSFKAQSFLHF